MTTSVQEPFPRFVDLNGQPLEGGYVYVGQANQDPVSNPIAVFFDTACTISASQPLRTSGGFIVDGSGTPQNVYVDGDTDFSMAVHNSVNAFLYSVASYPVRLLSSSITFGTIIVGTSIIPDAAGGASNGSNALPWSTVVARSMRARDVSVYSTTQPAAASDFVKQTQLMMPLLATNQTSITTTAAFFNAFNTNTATSVWTATGSYTVRPTVALPSTTLVVLASSIDNAGLGFRSVMARIISTTEIAVRVFDPANAPQDGAFSLVIWGNPAVADPIS